MRFDVDHAIRDHEERRSKRAAAPALVDLSLEAQLVAAIMCDVGVLERCDGVELDDFTDYRYRAIFVAIRTLQTRGEATGPLEVADEIARTDIEHDRNVGGTVDDFFIAELVHTTAQFWGCEYELAGAKRHLRTLAKRRQTA